MLKQLNSKAPHPASSVPRRYWARPCWTVFFTSLATNWHDHLSPLGTPEVQNLQFSSLILTSYPSSHSFPPFYGLILWSLKPSTFSQSSPPFWLSFFSSYPGSISAISTMCFLPSCLAISSLKQHCHPLSGSYSWACWSGWKNWPIYAASTHASPVCIKK